MTATSSGTVSPVADEPDRELWMVGGTIGVVMAAFLVVTAVAAVVIWVL